MHIVIVGNGISGVSCARWIRKLSNFQVTVISSESPFFFSRTALMYVYMGHMRFQDIKPYEDSFWPKNRISLVHKHVSSVEPQKKTLNCTDGSSIEYDKLVLALGSKSNKFGWSGQDLKGVSGLYDLKDLEQMEEFSKKLKRAVIVGGGLIGIEMAEMFRSRNIDVTMLVREKNYWDNVLPTEEATIVTNHILKHHIDLRLNTNLDKIIGDTDGVRSVIVKETGEEIECQYVGLTPGVSPNKDLVIETDIETNKGILVDEYLQTNLKDIYAIGDCAQLIQAKSGRSPIEAVWYTGRMMGETLAHTLCKQKTAYDPGIWFNSAKFLDIEYQIYGYVPNGEDDSVSHFYWQHQGGTKSIRIVYDIQTQEVRGLNLLGIRFRHEVCERWIRSKSTIKDVISNLSLAHFDPEFYDRFYSEILDHYNSQSGQSPIPIYNHNPQSIYHFLKQ